MERRSILIGLATMMVAPGTVLAATASLSSERFRWVPGGRVLVRGAGGWVESINLGDDIQVLSIDEAGAHAVLTASHAGQKFQLRSKDGRRWQAV